MDGQRRVTQSLRIRWRRSRRWLLAVDPPSAVRKIVRGSAVVFLCGSVGWGLVKGGHLSAGGNDQRSVASVFAERVGFGARDITISGLTHHDPEALMQALGLNPGDSLIGFDALQARRSLEALNWVASADVERRFPNQLLISVKEREPFAVWQRGSQYSAIDRSGIPMEGIALDQLKGLPMVTGDGANLAARELVEALAQAPDIQLRMQAAAFVGERRWNIYLDDGLRIMLPEKDFASALMRLAQLDTQTQILSKGIVAVDLRDPARLVVTTPEPQEENAGNDGKSRTLVSNR